MRFVADSTLGKLCRLLRMAGLDCHYDDRIPDARRLLHLSRTEGRIVLTRTERVKKSLAPDQVVLLRDNDPLRQVRQVMTQLNFRCEVASFLTRCLRCNDHLIEAQKDELVGLVPDYVRLHQHKFHRCPGCGRVYWPGSHARRMLERMADLFDTSHGGPKDLR